MEIKIRIRTPKGQAKGTEKKLRPFLLGGRQLSEVWTNEEDNELYWVVNTDVRNAMKISRNVAAYANIIKGMFDNKLMRKVSDKQLSPEDKAELKDMLLNQTEVEIIKEATAQEIVEGNKTFWQRIKEKFTRQNPEN